MSWGRSGVLRGTTGWDVSYVMLLEVKLERGEHVHTLSMTFSNETGQSMAKQTKRRSVSGYDSGRRRSYSS